MSQVKEQIPYNKFPQDLTARLEQIARLPSEGVRLRMKAIRRATKVVSMANGGMQTLDNQAVGGLEFIKNKWTFVWNGDVYQAAFTNGINPQGKTVMLNPSFNKGQLVLSPKNPEHIAIWKLIQIHPDFEQNIIGNTSDIKFYMVDEAAAIKSEMDKLELIDKAVDFVRRLKDDELMIIGTQLSLTGTKPAVRLSLRKMAEGSPDLVLATQDALKNVDKLKTLDYAWNLGIIGIDQKNSQIVFGGNNKKIIDFNIGYPDQKKFFEDLILNSKDKDVQTTYLTIKKLVDNHIVESDNPDAVTKSPIMEKADKPQREIPLS